MYDAAWPLLKELLQDAEAMTQITGSARYQPCRGSDCWDVTGPHTCGWYLWGEVRVPFEQRARYLLEPTAIHLSPGWDEEDDWG